MAIDWNQYNTTSQCNHYMIKSNVQRDLYSMKSEHIYSSEKLPKERKSRRKNYQTAKQIGLAMVLRNSDRNNQVFNLLSTPGYGTSTRQTSLWETRIANAVIKRMALNGGICIPFNLKKNVIPMFHPDNIDWLEDTPDVKNTSHLLMNNVSQSYLTWKILKV